MKKSIYRMIAILIIALLSLSLVGCKNSKEAETANAGNKKQNLTVNLADQTAYFPIKIAEELGYFKEEFEKDGITISVKSFKSGPPMIEAFTSGQLDIGLLGDQPVIQARSNNVDLKAISTFTSSEKAYGIFATEKSGIKSLQDLKGKKIGVPLGTTLHQLAFLYLKDAGLTKNDVQIANLQMQDIVTAMQSNSIDAAVSMDPYMNPLKKSGAIFLKDATGYKNVVTVVAGRNEFLKQNPEVAARILKVLDKATKWMYENKDKSIDIVVKKSGLSKEDVTSFYENRKSAINLNQDLIDSIQDTANFLKEQGITRSEVKISDMIDSSYLKAAGIK
ncbi:ABC transporter substrate-binding protein [Desulfitobacterium sp. Sab5]|uniref:ABC transporter substrate-binding protein n=1 Tax=Desulfitobacterium nosdiversum TaxID=3375356 RepID=UPI003CF1C6BD